MRAATSPRMRSVSARSGWVTATVPKSWSWTPTRPPRRLTRAISLTTRTGSVTCRITVIASVTSKLPSLNGSAAPFPTRSAILPPLAARQSFRASLRITRLGSTPTTLPRRPTIAARSRITTFVPHPTSRTTAPWRTGTKRRNRRRRRCCVRVAPRTSRLLASCTASGCASRSRHGSGWSAGAVKRWLSAAGGAPGALGAAIVTDLAVLDPGQRTCLHDVRVADEVLHELVGRVEARVEGPLGEPPEQRGQQHQRERQPEEHQHGTHPASAVRFDRDRAEELLVLGRQLRRDGAAG